MKRKTFTKYAALLLCISMIILSACGNSETNGGTTPDGTEVLAKWDFLVLNSLTHPSSVLCQEFATRVEEETGGQIQITVRAPGELNYNAADYLMAVGDGSVQVADVGSSCFGVLKAGALPCLPFIANGLDEFASVMEIVKPSLEEELNAFGAKLLFYYTWPSQSFWSKNIELNGIADLKNKKIRTVNSELSELVNIIGAVPVSLSGPEVPTGLQTGVVDGVITSAYGLGGAGWYDSLNFGLIADCQIIPSYMCVTLDEFNALPKDIQDVITNISNEFEETMSKTMFSDEMQWREDLQTKEGMIINTLSDEDRNSTIEKVQEYWVTWVNERKGNCPELLDQILSNKN